MTLQRLCFRQTFEDEQGAALVIALIMLVLVTIIGVAATNTSIVETLISGADIQRQQAFYVAEAGVEHVRGMLTSIFAQRNTAKMAASQSPDWDFALNGSEAGVIATTDTNYDGGSVWITNGSGGSGYTYNVRIWNNSEDGSATNDIDGVIYVRSDASRPKGGNASIEVMLQGSVSGGDSAITGYTAQAGAGAGKTYNAQDLYAITDFTQQLGSGT